MVTVTSGVVHGKKIDLADDPHLPDGEEVEVTIRPAKAKKVRVPADGVRRSAGAWAKHPEMDQTMAEMQKERKSSTRPAKPRKRLAKGGGIRRSAGAVPWDAEDDAILEQIHRERRDSGRREVRD